MKPENTRRHGGVTRTARVLFGGSLVLVTFLAGCSSSSDGPGDGSGIFSVGGLVAGLEEGERVRLELNGGASSVEVTADGRFRFPRRLGRGAAYAVTVAEHPHWQICRVTGGSGTIARAGVDNVAVLCEAPELTITPTETKRLRFTWTSLDGTASYELKEDPAGTGDGPADVAGFEPDGDAFEMEVFLPGRTQASYLLEYCRERDCRPTRAVQVDPATLGDAIGHHIIAPDARETFHTGLGVALSEDGGVLAVGVPGAVEGNPRGTGAVRLFRRADSGQWEPDEVVDAGPDGGNRLFGSQVALSAAGDRLAVGSPVARDAKGEVRIFDWTEAGWVERRVLARDDAEWLGRRIALSADGSRLAATALPGASSRSEACDEGSGEEGSDGGASEGEAAEDCLTDSDDEEPRAGRVFVFDLEDEAAAPARLASPGGSADDFGRGLSLAADGQMLAVGAPRGGDDAAGTVHLYRVDNGSWTHLETFQAAQRGEGDRFGYSVALSADGRVLAVGAYRESGGAAGIGAGPIGGSDAPLTGAVYVFEQAGGSWGEPVYIKASNPEGSASSVGDAFGYALALDGKGKRLAVGAWGKRVRGQGLDGDESLADGLRVGAAYVFRRGDDAWWQEAYVKAKVPGFGLFDAFGDAVALAGDGETLAVTAPGFASGRPSVYLY